MNTTVKTIINTATVIKELAHDVRSPLSSMKIQVLFASHIHGINRLTLEREITKMSEILNESIETYSEYTNSLTAIRDLAHELMVPISIIRMCVGSLDASAKDEQNFLFKALDRISGVLDSSIQKYSNKIVTGISADESVLVSKVITDIITEKNSEYKNYPIQIRYTFTPNSDAAIVKINQSDLERMLSNIINNSVEACNGKDGTIDIHLSKRGDGIKITISDNGCGIPAEVIAKIRGNEMVTHGKTSGQGIGYKQIRETLAKNGAMLSIESNQDLHGTTVTLAFPDPENI